MNQKFVSILLSALLLSSCGCSVVSLGGEATTSPSEKSGTASSQIAPISLQETPTKTEDLAMDITFNFETKRVLLNSGYEMPINGLGTYSLYDEECINSVTAALGSGVRLIDTAHAYGNEAEIGQAIRSSAVAREDIFVITKLYPDQFSDPEAAISEALEKLDIGYIDMMLLHHPGDGDVAAYKAMEQAVADGKIRSIGLSNWYVEELEEFLPQVSITPALTPSRKNRQQRALKNGMNLSNATKCNIKQQR